MPAPPTQIGPYRIMRLLGQGGMGAVYEAIQEPIERRVAVKVLLPQHAENAETLNRFFNEARAVNLIEHPSIVQVSDYGQTSDGTAYLVMECLRGDSLSSRLKQQRSAGQPLPWMVAVQVGVQLTDALTAAHEKSIVHRDLKPGNVMLVPDPVAPGGERVKILDFGIAKLAQEQQKGTATDAMIGTPQYMSPEQCRGAGRVDGKTDVYALGVMLYEMLAGRPPFIGATTIEYVTQHLFDEPPSLFDFAPQAHPPLVQLISRLLVKDKAKRPTMRAVGSELARLIGSGTMQVRATSLAVAQEMTGAEAGRRLPPATVIQSLGQTLKSFPHRRLKMVGAAVAMGMTVAMMMAIAMGAFPHPARNQTDTAAAAGPPVAPPAPALQYLAPAAPLGPSVGPLPAGPLPAGPPTDLQTVANVPVTLTPAVRPDASVSQPAAALRTPKNNATKLRTPPDSARSAKQKTRVRPSSKSTPKTSPPAKRSIRHED